MGGMSSGRFSGTRGKKDDGFRKVNGFTTKLHEGAQGKHVPGHNNFDPSKSTLKGGMKAAQELIDSFAGTGTFLDNHREVVECQKAIGEYSGYAGKKRATSRGVIHYGKKGAHIVPTHPDRSM